ncbi:MAG: outer membrane beta-barrel protein [Pseudomonadota bacterium]
MLTRTVIAVTLLASAPLASAEGFYVAGRIGASSVNDAASASQAIFGGPDLPSSVGLDGRPFDSSDTAAGLVVGWQAKSWLALELSYADLGEAESRPGGLIGPVPIVVPSVVSPSVPINVTPNALVRPFTTIQANRNAATLSVTEWSFAARFSAKLVSKLSANWSIGVSQSEFDAGGEFQFLQPITPTPTPPDPGFEFVGVPYESPSSEVGFNWGLGFEWAFNDRFAADVGYRQHKTGVIDVESVTLQLRLSL